MQARAGLHFLSVYEIAVIAGGKIIEKGTHGELISMGGVYEKLYNLQFKSAELNALSRL